MKKTYICPKSAAIILSAEESMLATVSGGGTGPETTPDGFNESVGGENTGAGGGYSEDLTRGQSSIWDTWK